MYPKQIRAESGILYGVLFFCPEERLCRMKAEASKESVSKTEAAQSKEPKAEGTKSSGTKVEAVQPREPKAEGMKSGEAKPKATKPGTSKTETSKTGTQKTVRAGAQKSSKAEIPKTADARARPAESDASVSKAGSQAGIIVTDKETIMS